MHGPLDVITPDELTIGQGNGTHYGKVSTHSPDWGYEGESETTYAALTWDIPSFQDESLTTEERRAIRDFYAQVDAEPEGADEGMFTLAEGATAPPMWLLFAAGGLLVAIFAVVALRSNKEDQW